MNFDNFIAHLTLFAVTTILLRRALQFFTTKVTSQASFYKRLQRVTRFRSQALVAGGIPVAAVMCLLFIFESSMGNRIPAPTTFTFSFFVFLGLIDDFFELRSLVKLGLQVIALGYWVSGFALSGEYAIVCGALFFISLGLTNSVNLLDGIDTLSTRLAQVGLIYFTLIALTFSLHFEAAVSIFLLSALTIFSKYNRGLNPLYLGETGVNVISITYLYLSYNIYKAISLSHNLKLGAFLSLLPLAFYGTEVLVSFVRRLANGRSPFAKDQLHLHHILTLRYGFSPFKSAYMIAILYFCSITLGASLSLSLGLHPFVSLTTCLAFCVFSQAFIARESWSIRPLSQGIGNLLFRRAASEHLQNNVIKLDQYLGTPKNEEIRSEGSDKLAS